MSALSLAWEFTDHVSIPAAMFFLALATPAVAAMKSAVQAHDTLHARFGESVKSMRAAIESEQLIPQLAVLAVDMHIRSGEAVKNTVNEIYDAMLAGDQAHFDDSERTLRSLVEDALHEATHRPTLDTLGELFFHRQEADRLQDEAIAWSRLKGVGSAVFLVALIMLFLPSVVKGVRFPDAAAQMSVLVALVGASYALSTWYYESRARRAITNLCRAYQ